MNPGSFRFCGGCGAELAIVTCAACGFETPGAYQFCGGCGVQLSFPSASAMAATPSEERKLATVLFADVVGFTALAEDADPETMARLVDGALRMLSDIVVRHGGTIDKYMGDAMMAVFGVPVAYGDDAERAVAAALAIQQAQSDLGFSIGVNTGEVMVMAVGGASVTVMGDAVNVAARLEKAANRGEILVGPLTVELTGATVEYRDRPPMMLKGKRQPVAVREAVRMRGRSARRRSSIAATAQLVGRDDELAFLRSLWRRAQAVRRTSIAMVTGDPGMGKTRLLEELSEDLSDEATLLHVAYPPYGDGGGPLVASDVLAQLGEIDDADVESRLRSLAGDIDPLLRDLDPAMLRDEQLWAFRRIIERRTMKRPLLALIDDVHVASAASLDLLAALAARVADLPALFVLSGRSDPRWLGRFPTASTLRLGPLPVSEAAQLAEAWRCDPAQVDALLRRSGGNPLFLRELIAYAKRGAVADATDTRVSADVRDARDGARAMPVTLAAILAARLDVLAPLERAVLQDLAVIGDRATVDHLVALQGPAAVDGLTSLTSVGLVRHRANGTVVVTEPLLREIAYGALPRSARADRHATLAELTDVAMSTEERARHFEAAVDQAPDDTSLRARAARASANAGLELLDAGRPTDAVGLLERAVSLGYREPSGLLRLASAQWERNRTDALPTLALLPETTGEPRLDADRVLALANALAEADPARSRTMFDDAIGRWRALGDPVKEGWAHSNKGVALFLQGNAREADQEVAAGLELFRFAGHRTGEMAAVSFRALVRPDHPDVEDWLQESHAFAMEDGNRSRQLGATLSLTWHHYLRLRLGGAADVAPARVHIDECAELAAELGWNDVLLQVLALKAQLARMCGDFAGAVSTIERFHRVGRIESAGVRALLRAVSRSVTGGVPIDLATGADPISGAAFVIAVEMALMEGRTKELIDGGFAERRSGLGASQAMVGFVPVAAALLSLGQFDAAEHYATEALSAAVSFGAELVSVGANAVLAETDLHRGRRDAAAHRLASVRADPEGLAGLLLLRARALLGDAQSPLATERLRELSDRLRAPGLMV